MPITDALVACFTSDLAGLGSVPASAARLDGDMKQPD